MSTSRVIVSSVIIALAACARAQVSPPALDPIVITAARSPQALSELLSDVSVIGQEEIARAGQSSLIEVLRQAPGVEVASNGGPGTVSTVFLRGANRGHTLVLIDGVRVDSSTDGAAALEAIPVAEIDHIEILRGPASSLYGADAIGGVIQVFTRRGEGAPKFSASVGAGRYRTRTADAGVSGSDARWRYSVHAGYAESDGFSAIHNPDNFSFNPDRDGYRAQSGSGELALRYRDTDELAVQFFANRLNAQFDASPDFDDRARTTLESYALTSRNHLAGNWQSILRGARSVDNSRFETGFGPNRFRTTQNQYLWQNDFSLPSGQLQLALERREERLASDTEFVATARNTNAALAVYQLREGPHALQANLRHDDSAQFGGRTTGALAYGYRLAPAWRVSASAGTAFKAPSFNDLYFPGFSNPNLRPETARNVEADVHYAVGSAGADLIVYRNRVRDLIVFQCDANFNCAPINVNNARLQGATLSAHVTLMDTRVQASIDVQNPEDEASGHLLARRAKRHASLALDRSFGGWSVGAEWLASSERFDDLGNTRRMGGYGLVNLAASYAFAPAWRVIVRGNNVFDKRYELAQDFATPGANVFAAIQYRQ